MQCEYSLYNLLCAFILFSNKCSGNCPKLRANWIYYNPGVLQFNAQYFYTLAAQIPNAGRLRH